MWPILEFNNCQIFFLGGGYILIVITVVSDLKFSGMKILKQKEIPKLFNHKKKLN